MGMEVLEHLWVPVSLLQVLALQMHLFKGACSARFPSWIQAMFRFSLIFSILSTLLTISLSCSRVIFARRTWSPKLHFRSFQLKTLETILGCTVPLSLIRVNIAQLSNTL